MRPGSVARALLVLLFCLQCTSPAALAEDEANAVHGGQLRARLEAMKRLEEGRLASTVEHTALSERLDARRREASLARWGAELVVVITWHGEPDLSPFATLFPLEHTRFVVYAKGSERSCDALPDALRPAVAACVVLPNALGREAHSMAHFVAVHYEELPRLVLFMQDDDIRSSTPRAERLAPLRNLQSQQAWRAWVLSVEAAPFTPASCLCLQTMERFPAGYMDMYRMPMQWFLETWLGHNISEWSMLRYPNEAMFLAPAAELRRRDRAVYRLVEELTEATAADQPDPKKQDATPQLAWHYGPGTPAGSLMWAHVMERLWLVLADANYNASERYDLKFVGER